MKSITLQFLILFFILPIILYSQSEYSEFVKQGNKYYQLKEYDKAIKSYKKATEIDLYNYLAYYNLAYTYYKMGDHIKAKENIEIVLGGKPDLKKAIELKKKINEKLSKTSEDELLIGEPDDITPTKSEQQKEEIEPKKTYTAFSEIEGIKGTGELQLKGYYILPPSSQKGDFIGDGLYLQYKHGMGESSGFQLIDLYMSMDIESGDIETYDYTTMSMGYNYLQAGIFWELAHPVVKDIAGELIKRQFGFTIAANLLRYDVATGMGMWIMEEWYSSAFHIGKFGFSANALLSYPIVQFLMIEGLFTYMYVNESSILQFGGDIVIAPFLSHPNYEIRLSTIINAIEDEDSYTLLSLGLAYKWGPLYRETSITGDVK